MYEISDAALDAHYRRIWEEDRGWDPYDGPYADDDDDDYEEEEY